MFVVVVELSVLPPHLEEFRRAVLENAALSLRDEVGCHRFDVATSSDDRAQLLLYEIYTDEAAFRQHLTTQHFLDFSAATGPWTLNKTVRTFRLEG